MRNVKLLSLAGVLLLAPALAFANGFALFEHGARAVALGGAFGAVADDATAGYYNPAGLAFQDGLLAQSGVYLITESARMKGANPYPGSNYRAKMVDQIFYPPHVHVAGKLGDRLAWGITVDAPFGLGTWWPDTYAGKFITKRVDLKVFNVNPNLAFKLSDNVAVALGIDYFKSSVDLTKAIGVINPYTQRAAEVGQVHMYTDLNDGLGYNLAFLAKMDGGWSVGASYRTRVKVKYEGVASFTQIPTGYADFDGLVATLLPFTSNPKAKTEVNYPAEYRLALAWKTGDLTLSADVVRMDWDSFKDLPITIVGRPDLSSVRAENYKDAYTYRLGLEWRKSADWKWLFGALWDATPVPTAAVSPLLPDADRWGITFGFSWDISPKMRFDLGFLHLVFVNRSTDGLDADNFNGTYKTNAELVGFTFGYRL